MSTVPLKLKPLACSSCAGLVPLADAEVVPCPYCGHPVPVPENLRALRGDLVLLTAERQAADQLYRRVGKPPWRILRVFLVFESPWFWMFGAGLWIVLSIVAFSYAVPYLSEHLLRVVSADVLTDAHDDAIAIDGTFATAGLGLLLAGWSRKRVISVGALQAALAATPPSSAGGPARCRRCGAALAVPAQALGARCDYCHADNLVEIPAAWVARAHRIQKKVALEQESAIRAEAAARRELRISMAWRLVLAGVIGLVMLAFWNMQPTNESFDTFDVFTEPWRLPIWTAERIPQVPCQNPALHFWHSANHCQGQRCTLGFLVPLRHDRPYHLFIDDPASDSEVVLERRQVGTLGARWEAVARGPASAAGTTWIPPLTAWYRVRVTELGPRGVKLCNRQE